MGWNPTGEVFMNFVKKNYQSFMSGVSNKLNPVQHLIRDDEGESHNTEISRYGVLRAYKDIEVVNRGTNLIVDSCSDITFDVKEKINGLGVLDRAIKKTKLNTLLNYQPNLYQDALAFKALLFIDLILSGDSFIYWDGVHMYHLPAHQVEVITSKTTYIKEFKYHEKSFKPDEVIWTRDNNYNTVFRGGSRLESAEFSLTVLVEMLNFQNSLFRNGMVPGVVISTPNTLSERLKDRTIAKWQSMYKPNTGGRTPMILDSDFSIDSLGNTDFKELEFTESIKTHEDRILSALGVPPVLLNSTGNSALSPNLKLFYIQTVLPLVEKQLRALERFFGYDLAVNTAEIRGMRDEVDKEASSLASLVNSGIITQNEAREKLRLEASTDEGADTLIKPANVAGSNTPGAESSTPGTTGGRPEEDKE